MAIKIGKSDGPYHIQAEINMIPLIDVALVLLIIFMVVSPILVQSQLAVKLPKVTAASSTAEETALKIEVDRSGQLGFKGKIVSLSELKAALQRSLPPGAKVSVLIQADRDVPFQHVVSAMDVAKQFKEVEKLGVSVIPEGVQ